MTKHFISGSCEGERCSICREPATHKLGEEIPHDDPIPHRHNLTAYVCCQHFVLVVGSAAPCHQHRGKWHYVAMTERGTLKNGTRCVVCGMLATIPVGDHLTMNIDAQTVLRVPGVCVSDPDLDPE